MKVVILAGGLGTRLSEETSLRPKPMVEIGDKPMLWHIMKLYSSFGFNDFIICLGYRGYMIKEYFANYFLHQTNVTIDIGNNSMEFIHPQSEKWKITMIDTGVDSMTGGRIKRIEPHVDGTFMLTYGDGLADIDLNELQESHKESKKLLTVTAVQPPGRFGALNLDSTNRVVSFIEKPHGDGAWINGGFFVCEPGIFKYIKDDASIWEREPMEKIAEAGQMNAYKHESFWKPMDTLRDKQELERYWKEGKAQWKKW
jgi:glucose-1-phosphate cytidylyltransferase